MSTTSGEPHSESLLDKLDSLAPAPLKTFDAFPKLPSTYKERSESRGFLTLIIVLLAFVLVLNDIGEFIWGWPDYEFSVDRDKGSFMNVNIDMVVNMPCTYLSVDLRDAVGDRLYVSQALKREGKKFDVGQATTLKTHQQALSARQAVSQSRRSRGLFDIFRRDKSLFKPTYNHAIDARSCRIYGSLEVKKVTANLHVTALGHGYSSSAQHVDHKYMNLSHVITEFSFGPYFPDITQPLDYSFEVAEQPFIAYQYFMHVVPTTYIAPRSKPLQTHQYSVTHYTRVLSPDKGTPGIFFKFDLDPMSLTIHQRTTSPLQLIIRCVGVIGGIFVCSGYAIRITSRAVDAVSGADKSPGIVAAEASGALGIRRKWGGGELRARNASAGRVIRQGGGWVVEGGSPYGSYAGTPVSGAFASTPGLPQSPYSPLPSASLSVNGNGALSPPESAYGLGFGTNGGSAFGPAASPRFGPSQPGSPFGFPTAATMGSPHPPSSPANYAQFPPTPNPESAGFPRSPVPGTPSRLRPAPPKSRSSNGSGAGIPKKDD